MSNVRLIVAKQDVYRAFRTWWYAQQPTFDAQFPVAMTRVPVRRYIRIVRAGTIFYRGQGAGRPAEPKRDTAWFAMDPWATFSYVVPTYDMQGRLSEYCEALGEISAFQARDEMEVVDMSEADNVRKMREEIAADNADVLEVFDDIWSVDAESGRVKRTSTLRLDVAWVKWMCAHGYDGYIASNKGGLHSELFLCEWRLHLQYLGTYNTHDTLQVDFCDYPTPSAFNINSK